MYMRPCIVGRPSCVVPSPYNYVHAQSLHAHAVRASHGCMPAMHGKVGKIRTFICFNEKPYTLE